jgi:hypothetical protein
MSPAKSPILAGEIARRRLISRCFGISVTKQVEVGGLSAVHVVPIKVSQREVGDVHLPERTGIARPRLT